METHTREHRSLLANAERRLLIAIARRLPAWVTSDQLTLLGLSSMVAAGLAFAIAPTVLVERRRLHPCVGGELVRRQPGRHPRPRPVPAAAALRLLRGSRHRSLRHGRADRRHGLFRIDDRTRRARAAGCLLPRVGRNVSRDAHGPRLPAVVRSDRADRASDSPRHWRRRRVRSIRFPTSAGSDTCCSTSAA